MTDTTSGILLISFEMVIISLLELIVNLKETKSSFTLTGSTERAGLVVEAFEDDDGDDAAAGNCDWVLSSEINPTCIAYS